ncbi:MAG: hypothetical protein IT294_06715 [Deltaproteobacteria bacterium]|nr:hypothetical protein [Deltaproteobacteria bacterium]
MLLATALIAHGSPTRADARPGDLDPSFGTGGTVLTTADEWYPWTFVTQLMRDGQGRIVAGGIGPGALLMRYGADGTLDPTFGTDGITVDWRLHWTLPPPFAIAADGRIYGGGYTFQEEEAILVRYDADGRPDPTFGTDGAVVLPIEAYDMAPLPDGKLLIAMPHRQRAATIRAARRGSTWSTIAAACDPPLGDRTTQRRAPRPRWSSRGLPRRHRERSELIRGGRNRAATNSEIVFPARLASRRTLSRSFGGSRSVIGLLPVDGRPAPAREPPWPGRISFPTRRPILIGSSLYTIRLLIEKLALSPVARTDDTDAVAPDHKADRQNTAAHPSKSEVPRLGPTMGGIFGEHDSRIIEHLLREFEGDAVFGEVIAGLVPVPLELHRRTIVDDARLSTS